MTNHGTAPPTAVVINLDYAGLGVARSLSAHGIPVVGLSAYRRTYGMFTRHARTLSCPDSRDNPHELLEFLLRLARKLESRAVIFPTCDHDLIFLDHFREQLEPYYALAIAGRSALHACLDKWETYVRAVDACVPVPKSWMIAGLGDVERVLPQVTFPCVLKPVASYHWRKAGDWQLVGGRKACQVSSPEELRREYAAVARADSRALIQQLIPGGDELLVVAACYLDRDSTWVAGFNTQKLAQSPPGFGSGCIVQSRDLPELFEPTLRLLQKMRFTGIAAAEYKWDETTQQYILIEINSRVWDQHRLGTCVGVDLPYLAYRELVGLPLLPVRRLAAARKWIAEDKFLTILIKVLWSREPGALALLRLARGKRIYGIWDWKDPVPAIAYFTVQFVPGLAWSGLRRLWSAIRRTVARSKPEREAVCEH
jgi:D-aspartate ligase